MNTEPKHTKGKVRADFRNWESGIPFGIVVPYKGSCIPIADVCGFPPYSAPVKEIIEANAARLVKCWNTHDELVNLITDFCIFFEHSNMQKHSLYKKAQEIKNSLKSPLSNVER